MPPARKLPPLPGSIKSLTDKQLTDRLLELGATVGPIVPTTRGVYERLLFKLQTGLTAAPSNNYEPVDDDEDNAYSYNVEPEPLRQPQSPQSGSGYRRTAYERTEIGNPLTRRSLHPGMGDYPRFHTPASKRIPRAAAPSQGARAPARTGSRLWMILLVIIVILAAVGFAVYRNMESEPVNPIPKEIE